MENRSFLWGTSHPASPTVPRGDDRAQEALYHQETELFHIPSSPTELYAFRGVLERLGCDACLFRPALDPPDAKGLVFSVKVTWIDCDNGGCEDREAQTSDHGNTARTLRIAATTSKRLPDKKLLSNLFGRMNTVSSFVI